MKLYVLLFHGCIAAFGICLGACGAASGNQDSPSSDGTGGDSTAGSGGATSSSGGGSSVGGGLAIDGGSSDGGELTEDAACAAEVFEAEPAPLNLMVMLDRSCSMSEPSAAPLWDQTKAGLKGFFADAALDGVGVALHYFPAPDTDEVTYCAGDQATPTVPMAKLTAASAPVDSQEQALFDSMDAQTFNFGGTPMFQALYGALAFANVFATEHADEQIAVVLVTDGVPGESCDFNANNNIPGIAKLAKFGFEHTPSIRSFAIGLSGSQEQDMSSIAQAGGGEAFFLGGSTNVTADLIAKLDSIKQSNLGCTFKLPATQPGKSEDPTKVNVKLLGESGDTPFVKVPGKSECVPDGWYYDDEDHPSKIQLCPMSCEQVKSDVGGKVQVLLGCASVIPK